MTSVKQIVISSTVSIFVVLLILYIFRYPLTTLLVPPPVGQVGITTFATATAATLIPDIIDQVDGAVVSVVATKDVPVYERYLEQFNPFGDWFGGFSVPRLRENGTESREVGGGTGFVVSRDGLIVTNRHVVADDKASYSVVLADGSIHEVTVKAKDPVFDIALLQFEKLPDSQLSYLTFGDSASVRRGDAVIVIGNALAEFDNSVSVGIISGIGRSITASDGRGMTEQLSNVFQTDAAINPGNSGGPLLNHQGEVIGVSVAASLGAENIGFAIPSDTVKHIVDSVTTYGEIKRPFLGVRYTMITERMAKKNNLDVTYGALVARGETMEDLAVMPGSPADKAGLRENDIITAIDGESLRHTDLATILRSKAVDATITMAVIRQGKTEEITVTLEPAPNE